MADERYKAAYEAAVEEIDELLVQVAEKKRFANMLAQKAGVDQRYDDVDAPVATGSQKIRPDQFANFTYPSEAARAFLETRGAHKGAVTLDVVFEALQQGGFAWGSAKNDPKGGLRIALGKDAQVRKLPNGTYGLWEWYPNAKRPAAKRAVASAVSSEATPDQADANDGDDDLPAHVKAELS